MHVNSSGPSYMLHCTFCGEAKMSEDLDKIVPELDRLMLRTLELMEEEIKNKVKMEETIKDGCLDLAKTRYIIGHHNVSSLQLPTEDSEEIKALATVVSAEETTNEVPHKVFQLNIESPSKITNKSANSPEPCNNEEDGVRQRVKNVSDESEDSAHSDVKSEKDMNSKNRNGEIRQSSSDPMKWFGVLVPQNLRRAQQSFQRALYLVAECATIQNELVITKEKFDVLYKQKQVILEKDK